ncbi:MAG: hypothetical protein DLM70_05150 [Chloroflexi bacterium]|nr:MAG: hypothetical protein DLM70_05150 [Chloroflexota bacterium]
MFRSVRRIARDAARQPDNFDVLQWRPAVRDVGGVQRLSQVRLPQPGPAQAPGQTGQSPIPLAFLDVQRRPGVSPTPRSGRLWVACGRVRGPVQQIE